MSFKEELSELIHKYTVIHKFNHNEPCASSVVFHDGRHLTNTEIEWWEAVALFHQIRSGALLEVVAQYEVLLPGDDKYTIVYSAADQTVVLTTLLDVADPESDDLKAKVLAMEEKADKIVQQQERAEDDNWEMIGPLYDRGGYKEYAQ